MKAKRFLSIFIAVLMFVSCFAISASADGTYTLKIYLYETNNSADIALDENSDTTAQTAPTGKTPIPNVKFQMYKVNDNETSTEIPTGVTPFNSSTDSNGYALFNTFTKGRYLVVADESTIPAYTDKTGTSYIVPFLVDLPRTNAEGTANESPVEVYPKMLVTGAIDFTKTFNGNAPATGVSATFSVTGPNSYTNTVTTDAGGHIKLEGLAFGDYTFTETSVTEPFEIDDANKTVTINVNKGGCFAEVSGNEIGTVAKGTLNNGSNTKPMISKKVSSDGTTFSTSANIDAYNSKEATWRIAVAVPADIHDYTEFKVADTIDSRLTYTADSAAVSYKDGTTMEADTATVAFDDATKALTVTFDQTKLTGDKIVYITFKTKIIDASNNITTGTAIPNHAVLSYKNAAYTDGNPVPTSENTQGKDPEDPTQDNPTTDPYVYTGELIVNKTDGTNKITSDTAKFVLYKENKTDVAVAEFETTDGTYTIKGLEDGTYYLKETKAPSGYVLSDEFIEVTINGGTAVANANVTKNVVNIPKTELPLTGGMGTALFSILGAAFVAFGGLMLIKSRKAKSSL